VTQQAQCWHQTVADDGGVTPAPSPPRSPWRRPSLSNAAPPSRRPHLDQPLPAGDIAARRPTRHHWPLRRPPVNACTSMPTSRPRGRGALLRSGGGTGFRMPIRFRRRRWRRPRAAVDRRHHCNAPTTPSPAARRCTLPESSRRTPGRRDGCRSTLLPGQSAEDVAAQASAIGQHLEVSQVWVVPLGRSRIRLKLPATPDGS
jgi:hypothetical protein